MIMNSINYVIYGNISNCKYVVSNKYSLKISAIVHHYSKYAALKGTSNKSIRKIMSHKPFLRKRGLIVAYIVSIIQQSGGAPLVHRCGRRKIIIDKNRQNAKNGRYPNSSFTIFDSNHSFIGHNFNTDYALVARHLNKNNLYLDLHDPVGEEFDIDEIKAINEENYTQFIDALQKEGPIILSIDRGNICRIEYDPESKLVDINENNYEAYSLDHIKVSISAK